MTALLLQELREVPRLLSGALHADGVAGLQREIHDRSVSVLEGLAHDLAAVLPRWLVRGVVHRVYEVAVLGARDEHCPDLSMQAALTRWQECGGQIRPPHYYPGPARETVP
jgi:hypothetical protein